jgi:hypothetical protein
VTEGTLTVTPALLKVSAIEDTSLVFNGASQTQTATIDGLQGTDQVSVTGLVSERDAGNYYSNLSVSGAALGNYTQEVVNAGFSIAKAALNVSGITAEDRIADGTTNAILNFTGASFQGLKGSDQMSVAGSGRFDTPEPGVNKPVFLSLIVSGSDLSNYRLTTQDRTYASIFAADNQGGNGGSEPVQPDFNGVNYVNATQRMLASLDLTSAPQILQTSSIQDFSANIVFSLTAETTQLINCGDQSPSSSISSLSNVCQCETTSKVHVETNEPEICYIPATQISELRL